MQYYYCLEIDLFINNGNKKEFVGKTTDTILMGTPLFMRIT
jgi:hypothetical protein